MKCCLKQNWPPSTDQFQKSASSAEWLTNIRSLCGGALSSLVIQFVFALLLTAMAASIAIWHMMKYLRSLLKNSLTDTPETISLAQEKRGLCSYWGVISLVDLLSIVAITTFERYGYWSRGDTLVATYGFLGLIGIDWAALLAVVLSDILLGKIIIKIVGSKIEKQCAGSHVQ